MPARISHLNTALAGRYQIEREVGSGGMATVYVAQDLKHGRKVAVKVVHSDLAAVLGGERFLREIEIAAKLQHPHILPLHDSGDADGVLYYVMPFVDGESLRTRLRREKQLPVSEAVRIAIQVASALESAHRQGIIHRDIKPENILLHQGEVMVADFGIALALRAAGGSRLTETGLSLGTPQYMSPEQATGDRQLDARTDIYSLGAVLYEMLIGEPPHTGPTVQAIIARLVTERAPTLRPMRETIPPGVEEAVSRSLAKLPADRFATAQEFGDALQRAISGPVKQTVYFGETMQVTAMKAATPPRRRKWLIWVAGVLAIGAAGALGIWGQRVWQRRVPTSTILTRFGVRLAPGRTLTQVAGPPVAVSPDGTKLVYAATERDTSRLFIRPMDRLFGTPIPGTEGAAAPFFSWDGQKVGFFAGGQLKRVTLTTSVVETIAHIPMTQGASWGSGDTLILGGSSPSAPAPTGLQLLDASGQLQPLTSIQIGADENQESHLWPQVLPDGKTVMFTIWHPRSSRIATVNLTTGERRTILDPASYARYVPTGHILFARDGSLRIAPFNIGSLEITGPEEVVEDKLAMRNLGSAYFAVSRNGTLAWVPGTSASSEPILVWATRVGEIEALRLPLAIALAPYRISPDGKRLLVMSHASYHVYDLESGSLGPHIADGTLQAGAVWTADGRGIIYNAPDGATGGRLYRRRDTENSDAQLLIETTAIPHPQATSPDGKILLYDQGVDPQTGFDIWALTLDSALTSQPLIRSAANEFQPMFSQDQRWLAYVSDESGRSEVYVRRYPVAGETATRISRDGGREPLWSPNGREVFFRSPGGDSIFAVTVTPREHAVDAGAPRLLFTGSFAVSDPWIRQFDLSPDASRFLLVRQPTPPPALAEYNVAVNWFQDFKRLFGFHNARNGLSERAASGR
jgi:eukaryotic-like serine/threonine-protein kinase